MGNTFTDATEATVGSSSASDAYNFWDVVERVADFLGYGSDLTGDGAGDNWTRVKRCVEDGYRQFIFPPLADGAHSRQWSFLKPQTTLAFVADTWEYTMPDNFGGMLESFRWPAGTGYSNSMKQVEASEIIRMRAGADLSSEPMYWALRPVALTASTGQRWQAIFHPTPSTARTMIYRYRVLPSLWGTSRLSQSVEVQEQKGTGDTATASAATTTITDTAATFESWGVAAGDPFIINAGTATAGTYEVASVTDETHLVLTVSAGTGTCSYIVGESYVTLVGAGNYTTAAIVAGDRVVLTGTGGATEGIYTVSTKDSTTRLTLTEGVGGSGTMNAQVFPATLYPYGGVLHSQTILASCLQQAEEQVSDIMGGPKYQAWQMALARSLAIDRENDGVLVGYNGDNSDGVVVRGIVATSLTHEGTTITF